MFEEKIGNLPFKNALIHQMVKCLLTFVAIFLIKNINRLRTLTKDLRKNIFGHSFFEITFANGL